MSGTAVRRRLSPEQRRDQLSRAAITVIAGRGYQAATAEAIGSQAGISKGLLWHYFTDLDDLLETTARQTLVALRTAVASDLDLTAPAPQLIRAAVHRAAMLPQTHGAELSASRQIALNLRNQDGTLRLGPDEYNETHAHQADLFRRGQYDGDIRNGLDPHLLAVTYQGAVDTMLAYLDAHPDTDPDQHADTVASILLNGIC